jgi:hypothetical protein
MPIETLTEPHPQSESSVEDNREVAFATLVRQAIETRFTQHDIITATQERTTNEYMETFIRDYKRWLTEQLVETAETAIVSFLTDLMPLRDTTSPTPFPAPGGTGGETSHP